MNTPADFLPLPNLCRDLGTEPHDVMMCVDFEGIMQPRWSPFSKFTILLAANGFGAIGMGISEQDDRCFVQRIPEKPKARADIGKKISVLIEHTGCAWYEFLHDRVPTSQESAIALAQIASHRLFTIIGLPTSLRRTLLSFFSRCGSELKRHSSVS
jgi:hypothetical protein